MGKVLSIPADHLPSGNSWHDDAVEYFQRRAAIVKQLIENGFEGSKVRFADKIGIDPTTVSRWYMTGPGRKNIGEKMARRIESKCGLASGALVYPDKVMSRTSREERLLEAFRDAADTVQAAIERALGIMPNSPHLSDTGVLRVLDKIPPEKPKPPKRKN